MKHTPKTYDVILLANHKPSQWAEDTVNEYTKDKDDFTEVKKWRVTNNYSLKKLKKQHKFDDLPCFIVTKQIARNRKTRDYYYGDEIEEICKGEFREALRKNAEQTQRENRAALRLRVSKAKRKFKRDIMAAAEDVEKGRRCMSDVCTRKRE